MQPPSKELGWALSLRDVRPVFRNCGQLAVLLLLVPSLLWIALDRSVWQWDQSWYGEVSVDLYASLQQGLRPWKEAMRSAFGAKAPGIAWFGQWFVPAGQILGSMNFALHLSILVCQGITLVLIHRIGALLGARIGVGNRSLIPFAGCVLVGGAPLFVGMSHQYFAEPLQTLSVAWLLYAALAGPSWTRLRTMTHLIAAGSVAMLAKTSTPAYCLLPGLMAVATLFERKPREPATPGQVGRTIVSCLCFLASLVLLHATVRWYEKNLAEVLAHAYDASLGGDADYYGTRAPFAIKLWFWIGLMRRSLFASVSFWFVLPTAAAGAALAVNRFVRHREGFVFSRVGVLALFCVAHVAGFLALAARSTNEEPRFLMPLLPLLALLFMGALAQINNRWITLACVMLLFVQWVDVYGTAFGLLERNECSWLLPAKSDAGKSQEIARIVALTSEDEATANRMNVVGVETPWLNANVCSYFAAQQKLRTRTRSYYTSLGYAVKDEAKAIRRMEDMRTLHFVTAEGPFPHDFLNEVSEAVAEKVAKDDRYERVAFSSAFGVVVYRRKDVPLPQARP